MANIEPQAVIDEAPPEDLTAPEVEEVVEKILGEQLVEEVTAGGPIEEDIAEEPIQEILAKQPPEIVDEILEHAVERAVEKQNEGPFEQVIETRGSSPSTIPEETSEQIVDQPAFTVIEEGPVVIEDAPVIVTTELEKAMEQRATSMSEQPTIIITQEPDTVRVVSARASSSSTSATGSIVHNEAASMAPMIKTEKTVRFDKPRMRDRVRHRTIRAGTLKTLLGREVYAAKGDEIHKLLAERAGRGIGPRIVETQAAA